MKNQRGTNWSKIKKLKSSGGLESALERGQHESYFDIKNTCKKNTLMQMPAVALFGAGNMAVGVLPLKASSEMKRNIYSRRFRFAVQLNGIGVSRIFIGRGCKS